MNNTLAPYIPIKAISISDRLDSWKAIAGYLGREVRTAQRWEKKESLPVHRHIHSKGSSVYAFKHEIDEWLLKRRAVAGCDDRGDRHAVPARPRAIPKTPMPILPLRLQVQPIGEPLRVPSGGGAVSGPSWLELCVGAHRIRLSVRVESQASVNTRRR